MDEVNSFFIMRVLGDDTESLLDAIKKGRVWFVFGYTLKKKWVIVTHNCLKLVLFAVIKMLQSDTA